MKTKIRKYCFPQYFWLIIWTIPKNVNFDQKTAVRGAISQKEGIEILQDAPHIEAFWNPDQVVSSAFMEMKVTLEEGCAWQIWLSTALKNIQIMISSSLLITGWMYKGTKDITGYIT